MCNYQNLFKNSFKINTFLLNLADIIWICRKRQKGAKHRHPRVNKCPCGVPNHRGTYTNANVKDYVRGVQRWIPSQKCFHGASTLTLFYAIWLPKVSVSAHTLHHKRLTATKNWLIEALWKGLGGGHVKKPPRLMPAINRGGHFLLTEAVKKTASQNILSEAVVLLTEAVKTTASVNNLRRRTCTKCPPQKIQPSPNEPMNPFAENTI